MKLNTLPFTAKDLAFWRTEIKSARQKREEVAEQYGWEENLKRYVPRPAKSDGKIDSDVNIGADFRDVERKKAALFYDRPDVSLEVPQDYELTPPKGTQPPPRPLSLSTLTSWHQELLNELLGPQHANAKPTILKAIFNCLCPSGVGPVSVGYQVTMKTVETLAPVMDPMGQPMMEPMTATEMVGSALGMPVMPKPMMQPVSVEVPIDERWFISESSPKALLIPASFRSTDFKRAPWLGKDWRKPLSQVRREYGLPKTWTVGRADDETKPYFENSRTENHEEDAGDPYVSGVDITYRTQLRSDEEVHPDAMRRLVLVDGKDEPVEHRDSPWQDFTDTGEMTADSLRGFPDRPLVLRDLSDSAWIPSDCAVTRQLTREGEKYRKQIIEQRDGNKLVIAFDSDKMDPTATDKIKNANGVIWVPVAGGALAQGKDSIMVQVAQPSLGRESYMGMDVIDHDRAGILGIDANQAGQQSKGRKTATEQSIVQRNSEARFEQERQRVLEWYLDVVAAFDTLVIRYADERIAVKILGENRGKLWAQFKGALAGGYGYNLRVDSGKYLDIEADRRQKLQVYGQMRQDPLVNPKLLIDDLAAAFGYDPSEFYVPPSKPQKELKVNIAIKGEDLNPSNPAFAIMVELARQGGWQISPASVQMAQQQASAVTQGMLPVSGVGPDPNAPQQAQHPGAQPKAPNINQHVQDETGQREGPKVIM